ncbi:transmembrane protein 208-like [Argonauta hians]
MPPKGKQKTKGQKQILEENHKTLTFYKQVIIAVNVSYIVLQYLFFWDSYTFLPFFLTCLACLAYFASYKFMTNMANASFGDEKQLLDAGIDLNMESGMAEHSKDLILMTCIVQILSLISNYFWLLWLVVPGRAFYLLWVNILAPWFFAPAPEENEKKIRKMERRMRRQH